MIKVMYSVIKNGIIWGTYDYYEEANDVANELRNGFSDDDIEVVNCDL